MRSPGLPVATLAIVGITCIIFLLQLLHPNGADAARQQWGLTPSLLWSGGQMADTTLPAWLGLLSVIFIHGGWSHLATNMLLLLALGNGVEARLGRLRFSVLYLGSGWLAGLGVALLHHKLDHSMAGASLSVTGVWAAWLLAPRAAMARSYPAGGKPPANRRLGWSLGVAAIFAACWVGIGWFGPQLLQAASGMDWRIFWSRSFSAHCFGALAGTLIMLLYLALDRLALQRN